jgi:hypothetical protein
MATTAFSRGLGLAAAVVAMLLVAGPVEAQYTGVYDSAWGRITLEQQPDGRVVGVYTTGINGRPGRITGELREKENFEGDRYRYVRGTFRDNACYEGFDDLGSAQCEGSFNIDFLYYPDDTSEFVAWYWPFGSNAADKALWGQRVPLDDEDFDS